MILLVTGSRNGHKHVDWVLDRWVECFGVPDKVVLGDARGVDTQARTWAIHHLYTYEVHRADWDGQGKAAGMMRNRKMVDSAGPGAICVAFPVGESRGTRGCMAYARTQGMKVVEVPGAWARKHV